MCEYQVVAKRQVPIFIDDIDELEFFVDISSIELNRLAKEGWKVISTVATENLIVWTLERDLVFASPYR